MTEMIIKLDLDMTERELLKEFSKRCKDLENKISDKHVYNVVMEAVKETYEPKELFFGIASLERDIRICKNFLKEIHTVIDAYHRENDIGSRGNVQ